MRFFRGLLVGRTSKTHVQLFRYGFVAFVALVVDFGSLVLMTEYAKLHYLVSASLSFLAGLVTNYALSRLWVFNSTRLSDARLAFLVFALIGVVGLGITDVTMWLLTGLAGLHYVASKAIATVISFFWNFGARKKLVFV